MEILRKMNLKLDEGWKMTNFSCEKCNGTTLAEPNKLSQYYCPKCDEIYAVQLQQQSEEENMGSEFENLTPEKSSNRPSSADAQDEEYFHQVIQESGVFDSHNQSPSKTFTNAEGNKETQYERKLASKFQGDQTTDSIKRQEKSNETSKKIGQKLVTGWTMLQQCCLECNVPLMRSKQGQKICCGCDRDFAQLESTNVEPKQKNLTQPSQYSKKIPQGHEQSKPVSSVQERPRKVDEPKRQSLFGQQPLQTGKSLENQNLSKIERIETKALDFIEKRLDEAIAENDIELVHKILHSIRRCRS